MKYYEDPEAKKAIDDILSKNATMQANLGSEHAKAQWREWLKDIRAIDPEFAKRVQEQE